jgi:hypothetical protein
MKSRNHIKINTSGKNFHFFLRKKNATSVYKEETVTFAPLLWYREENGGRMDKQEEGEEICEKGMR